jgi:hypothetical protein
MITLPLRNSWAVFSIGMFLLFRCLPVSLSGSFAVRSNEVPAVQLVSKSQ